MQDPARQWRPEVTVAAIVPRQGRFLFVREHSPEGVVLNQPAGHLEPGESLEEAVRRETLEETGWRVEPRAVVGLYLWQSPANGITYLRVCFHAEALHHETDRNLDEGILGTEWLSAAALARSPVPRRSPLVERCLQDYLEGRSFPLHLIHHGAGTGPGIES